MQTVVLAAGEGTRMRPLSARRPKPMLPVGDRPIVGHAMTAAADAGADEFVVVVGYEGDRIRSRFGDSYRGVPIEYVEQERRDGTAGALRAAAGHVDDRFAVLNGDNLYGAEDLAALFSHDAAVGTTAVANPADYGVVGVTDGVVDGVVEKPDEPPSNRINTGAYVLPFETVDRVDVPVSERGERELTDTLARTIDQTAVVPVSFDRWLDVGRPWELLEANERHLDSVTGAVDGSVHAEATVRGPVVVEPGARVEADSVVSGPALVRSGARVESNATIRGATVLGEDVVVGHGAEVSNSLVMAGTELGHLSHVGDSVLGRNVRVGAGTVVANRTGDRDPVPTTVRGEIVSTGREAYGVVAGDEVTIGINATIDPGATLSEGTNVTPGSVVSFDPFA